MNCKVCELERPWRGPAWLALSTATFVSALLSSIVLTAPAHPRD